MREQAGDDEAIFRMVVSLPTTTRAMQIYQTDNKGRSRRVEKLYLRRNVNLFWEMREGKRTLRVTVQSPFLRFEICHFRVEATRQFLF